MKVIILFEDFSAVGYGKMWNIIPESTLYLDMCKDEKHKDHMAKGKP